VADEELERIARILGVGREAIVDSAWADNGPGWVAVRLGSAEEVLALRPRGDGGHVDIGVVGMHLPDSECAYEVRAIFTNDRGEIVEDPVTGSLNASVAQWLTGAGVVEPPYVASQGTAMGRAGRVHVSRDTDGAIWVGGATRTIVEGMVDVE
jgi:predicted PhzF superfamily epimerase YddE/YHI9